jgi:hypothetical protein
MGAAEKGGRLEVGGTGAAASGTTRSASVASPLSPNLHSNNPQ